MARSKRSAAVSYTAEKVARVGLKHQPDAMYYVKDGDIWSVPRRKPGERPGRATRLAEAGIQMDYAQYLYFIDADGDIARKRRRPSAKEERPQNGDSQTSAGPGSPLTLIEDERAIARAQRVLRDALFGAAHQRPRELATGHRGGPAVARAVWFDKLDFWYGSNVEHNRYWNGFGLGNPFDSSSMRSIVAEVNPAKRGRDARVQGAFAMEDGRVLLIHRGRLGGGKAGVGGSFRDWYPAPGRRPLIEGGRETSVIAIGYLDDAQELLRSLHDFVKLAASYKAGEEQPRSGQRAAVSAYRPEFGGNTSYVRPEREVDVDWLHGRIVDVLRRELAAHGYTAHNDKHRDLYLTKARHPTLLFEVKTSHALQDLYTAIGQLHWHATGDTHRVVVVPADVGVESRARLESLGLSCITFDHEGASPSVSGLGELLQRWRRNA